MARYLIIPCNGKSWQVTADKLIPKAEGFILLRHADGTETVLVPENVTGVLSVDHAMPID